MSTRREFIKQVSVAAGVSAAVMGLGLAPGKLLAASAGDWFMPDEGDPHERAFIAFGAQRHAGLTLLGDVLHHGQKARWRRGYGGQGEGLAAITTPDNSEPRIGCRRLVKPKTRRPAKSKAPGERPDLILKPAVQNVAFEKPAGS